MARIEIKDQYVTYLEGLVKAGFFDSMESAAEALIYKQMIEDEKMRLSSVERALRVGEFDIQAGRTVNYSTTLISEISERGKQDALGGNPVKKDVRP